MKIAYKIILTPTEEGYLVTIPDLDCNTQGKDIADAMFMARDAIGLMGMALEDMGKTLPHPKAAHHKLSEDDIETFVDVDFDDYRKRHDNRRVKKTLSIPSWLNKKAEAEHINFSRVLEEALTAKLKECD